MAIFIDPAALRGRLFFPPRVRNEDGTLEHVHCEGARFHVLWWDTRGEHCSEPECEVNLPHPFNDGGGGGESGFR